MLPITRPPTEVVLTPQDLAEWPARAQAQTLINRCAERQPVSFSMPPLKRAVPICRQLAGLWLDAQDVTDEDARYIALLVMSELMTNAVEHSGSARITNCLRRDDDRLLMEIRDQSRTSSVPRQLHRVSRVRESGRGLALVATLAQDWGVDSGRDGVCSVWAAVRLGRRSADTQAPAGGHGARR